MLAIMAGAKAFLPYLPRLHAFTNYNEVEQRSIPASTYSNTLPFTASGEILVGSLGPSLLTAHRFHQLHPHHHPRLRSPLELRCTDLLMQQIL